MLNRTLARTLFASTTAKRVNLISSHFSPPHSATKTLSQPVSARKMSSSIPSTMKAIQIQEQGDIDVIQLKEVAVPQVKAGHVLYKNEWAGVNFIDTYQRGGIYKLPTPFVLGNESAGEIVAVGEGVEDLKVGDKVAAYTALGSFAQFVSCPAAKAAKLPSNLSTREAATVILQGLTALTFVREAHAVKKGEFILIQAAAGGLGLLLVQLCKHLGATVIGTTSSKEKAELAKKAGADHVILYGQGVDIVQEVYKITGGEGIDRGVAAVFDGVGKDTFDSAFDLVKRKGTIVTLGNASGPVPPFAPLKLGPKNLKVCRPVLGQYVHTAEEFKSYATELFEIVEKGQLKLSVHGEYEFSAEGLKQAHRDITSRKTSGKLIVKID